MIHKKTVDKYNGNITELVNDISNLHYDTLKDFLLLLSLKLKNDSIKDMDNNRPQLSNTLKNASNSIYDSYLHINKAFKISIKYME